MLQGYPLPPHNPFAFCEGIKIPAAHRLALTPAWLTDHRGLDETPRVGLGDVGLQHARGSAGLVHPPKDVDLAPTHGGRGRVHSLGQGGDGLPLVGDGVVPGDDRRCSDLSWAAPGSTDRNRKQKKSRGGNAFYFFLNTLQIQPLGKQCNECFSLRF